MHLPGRGGSGAGFGGRGPGWWVLSLYCSSELLTNYAFRIAGIPTIECNDDATRGKRAKE
jgi:hypothetical protein